MEKILNRKLETVTLLMDGGYDSLVNLLLLSDKGYNVISGTKANKNFKISEDEQINEEIIKLYKCRGIVENYFARMKQYRILRNQFEKTMESYTGLYMFSNCLSLYKKLVHLEKIIWRIFKIIWREKRKTKIKNGNIQRKSKEYEN